MAQGLMKRSEAFSEHTSSTSAHRAPVLSFPEGRRPLDGALVTSFLPLDLSHQITQEQGQSLEILYRHHDESRAIQANVH